VNRGLRDFGACAVRFGAGPGCSWRTSVGQQPACINLPKINPRLGVLNLLEIHGPGGYTAQTDDLKALLFASC
jgi:hypothetical protein